MSESSQARSFAWPIVLSSVVGLVGIWVIVTNEEASGIWIGLALVGLATAGILRYEIAERGEASATPSRNKGLVLAVALLPWLAILLGLLSGVQFLISVGAIGVWSMPIAIIVAAVARRERRSPPRPDAS